MRPDGPRDPVAGPDSGPESPFPIKLWGPVIKGFGRGSKELGIPTANIPPTALETPSTPDLKSGVYYGFVGLKLLPISPHSSTTSTSSTTTSSSTTSQELKQTYPAVLSIGYNPFYANTKRSIEIHILHSFPADFYGASLNLLICGFIRPEYDYVSKESLIEDIMVDCDVARQSLVRENYRGLEKEEWLRGFEWESRVDFKEAEREVLGEKK